MKKLLLKTMLLLFALIAGSSSVWADTKTDELTQSWTGISGTNYSTWSEKKSTSDAVYAGNSAGGNSSIQLRSNNSNSGVVTTASGGKVKSITVTWNSNTASGRTLNVYGKNSAYSAASDLYNASNQGTLIGTIVCGTSTKLNITDDYKYVGFRSASGAMYLDEVDIEWEPVSASTAATTTTIDDSGITNTDVYQSTTAGSLSASVTVTEGGAAVDGATVTWSSSDEGVATIAADGTVTLVAAGTVTFTANYAGVTDKYAESSDTYEMTVTSSEPYVQPTEIEITPNYTFWGKDGQFSGSTYSNLSGSQDNVSLAWTKGDGSTYANQNAMRFYKDNTLTFTAPTGYEIKSIKLDVTGTYSDLTFSPTEFDSETTTWSGAATTVTMSRPSDASSYSTISKYTITIGLPSSVATPTFTVAADTYSEAQNVKVSNYDEDYMYFYTTDGTDPDCDSNLDPTGTSLVYDHATGIDVTATTTLKMIAVDIDGNKSSVATAAYTIQLPYTTIAEVKALASGTSFKLNLTGAQVVYIDDAKKNIYVRDASGAIVLFNNSGFSTSLTTGDILSGTIEGTYSPYKNLPEITSIVDISVLTSTGNSTVVAKTITGTTEAIAANLCDLVKIEGTEIAESSSKYYVGESSDIQLYDNFKVGYTVTTGKTVDVSGIATVFNTTYELFPRFESDIVYLDESEEIEISAAGVATFCSANALDFTAVDAIKVYIAKAEADKVTLTEIKKVPANTGVILMNALGMSEGAVAAINVPYLETTADDVEENELVGITTATVVNAMSAGKYNYILSNETAGVGFYRAVDGVQLAANKAYLSTTVNAAVRDFLGFTEGGSDAIIEIAKNEKMSAIYDLSGRRVVKPTKGLYIVNGKKVVK